MNKREKFRDFCSEVMQSYEENGKWSSFELKTKEFLEDLGFEENIDYWHNLKIQNPSQSGYYAVDFLIPDLNLAIECDGSLWHSDMGNRNVSDYKKDVWLQKLGFQVIRFENPEEGLENLEEILEGKV